jgi:hypothetical protein
MTFGAQKLELKRKKKDAAIHLHPEFGPTLLFTRPFLAR